MELRPTTEMKGFNMERILVKYEHGYMTTGFYKDGMVRLDGDHPHSAQHLPSEFESFVLLSDLKKIL